MLSLLVSTPSSRASTVTIMARLIWALGEKVSSPVPWNSSRLDVKSMASAPQVLLDTSAKSLLLSRIITVSPSRSSTRIPLSVPATVFSNVLVPSAFTRMATVPAVIRSTENSSRMVTLSGKWAVTVGALSGLEVTGSVGMGRPVSVPPVSWSNSADGVTWTSILPFWCMCTTTILPSGIVVVAVWEPSGLLTVTVTLPSGCTTVSVFPLDTAPPPVDPPEAPPPVLPPEDAVGTAVIMPGSLLPIALIAVTWNV